MNHPEQVVRAGVIGCGASAAGIVAQFPRVPQLEIPVVADTDPAAARSAYRLAADVSGGELITCGKVVAPPGSVLWDLRARQDRHFL